MSSPDLLGPYLRARRTTQIATPASTRMPATVPTISGPVTKSEVDNGLGAVVADGSGASVVSGTAVGA